MSMVPFDFLTWAKRPLKPQVSIFRPLQLLQGHSLADIYHSDAVLLQKMIDESEMEKMPNRDTESLIEQIFTHDDTRGLRKIYQDLGILIQDHEMCSDLHITNPIQRCLSDNGKPDKMDSIDVILKAILSL